MQKSISAPALHTLFLILRLGFCRDRPKEGGEVVRVRDEQSRVGEMFAFIMHDARPGKPSTLDRSGAIGNLASVRCEVAKGGAI